jgi:hypothetical protein
MAITVKHLKVSLIPDSGDDTLIEPSDWNADHELTGTIPVENGGTGASTLTGYVKGTGTTAMTASATIPNTDITGLGTASTKDAGSANGVATLDAGGKVPVSELPAAVLGALSYQGTWNASTNTPTLTSSTGTKGYYYVVAVAGSTDLDGITDWQIGDWAVYNGTVWQKVDNSDAGGDVVGPASATDNALARFDTTTGKLIQNSTVIIDDNGNASGVNAVTFDTTPATTPTSAGSLAWNSSEGTLDLVMRTGNVTQHIGEEFFYTARNATGSTISKGTPVMVTGVTAGSNRIEVSKAIANGTIDELRYIGITAEAMSNGTNGLVTEVGYIRNIDTTGTPFGETWAVGDILYVSPTTAGYLTKVQPTAPNLKIVTAIVISVDNNFGSLLVRPTPYPHITDLSDVNIATPASGNVLIYDATQSRWENASLTASTGISITDGAGSVTVTNTAPDQVVALTGGGTTTITGTYPNFTISSDDQFDGTVTSVDASGGTGISVSGGPITSSGTLTITNTAPDQVVSLTGGGTTTITGTYPNFTISSDDQFDGTVTSVDLSAGTGISVSGGPITSSGSITVTNTAPDQVVSISGGGTTTVTGTYPNFTVSSDDQFDGTVTSVGGTGTVSGISLSGTVTSSGNLTLGGTLDLSSPPVIGGTAPNTVNGTVLNATNGIVVNSNTVSASYTIPSGSSAMSAGPMTVASGQTVTVSSGSRWVIL